MTAYEHALIADRLYHPERYAVATMGMRGTGVYARRAAVTLAAKQLRATGPGGATSTATKALTAQQQPLQQQLRHDQAASGLSSTAPARMQPAGSRR